MRKKVITALLALVLATSGLSPVYGNSPYSPIVEDVTENRLEENHQEEWLSVEERIYGLSLIWRYLAEMSPHMSALPAEFDWNALYLEYISKVINAQGMAEYYEILSRFVALLGDGKSMLQANYTYIFPISVRYIDSRYVVYAVNPDFADIPVGSVIVSIDGIDTNYFLESTWGDMLGNHTPKTRQNFLANRLQGGLRANSFAIEALTPDGEIIYETISFIPIPEDLTELFVGVESLQDERIAVEDMISLIGADVVVHEGDIHHIIIHGFGNPAMPESVRQYIENVADSAQAFIFDVRRTGGGAADWVILSQFADVREFGSVRAYRQVRDAGPMGLAALFIMQEALGAELPEELWELTIHGYSIRQGRDMFESRHLEELYAIEGSDLWDANIHYEQSLRLFDIPVVILSGYMGGSAVENFIVAVQGAENFTVMGTNTMGMGGDMIMFLLPGEILFGLNLTRQYLPNGQVLNNYGIAPDIWVQQSLSDLLNGIDTQLVYALEYLSEKLSE